MSSMPTYRNTVLLAICLLIGMSGCKNAKSNDHDPGSIDTSLSVVPTSSDTMMASPSDLPVAKDDKTSDNVSTIDPATQPNQTPSPSKSKGASNVSTSTSSTVKPVATTTINPKPTTTETKQGDFVIEEKAEPIKPVPGTVKDTPKNVKPNHDAFHSLLSKYVSANGAVNYKAWKKNMASLNDYITAMSDIDVNTLKGNEKMAYCLNVYNANTIKLVLDHYPVKSIQNIAGGKPWDERIVKSGSSYFSLNEWENGVIRKMGESRIHFALNCAAKSCPPLQNQAFSTANVTAKMQSLTSQFINGPANSISADKLVISKIFDWYKADFGDSVVEYLNKYVTLPIKSSAKITYQDYDWSLNE